MNSHPDPVVESSWLHALRRVAGALVRFVFDLTVTGEEHVPRSGPLLVAGNHSSFLDGPIMFALLPRSSTFLIKEEMYVGWLARFLHAARQIPVRRGTPDRTAVRRCLEVVRGGGALGIFPEGTRGSGTFESFHDGVAYLALKTGAPVLPVVCLGTGTALPKGRRVPRPRARVDIVYGEPFRVQVPGDPRARATVAAAGELVHRRLRQHLLESAREHGQQLRGEAMSA